MKKILAVSLAGLLAAASLSLTAHARNASGDGSTEDSYVEGQKATAPEGNVQHDRGGNAGRHEGDGSREDSYVPDKKIDSPLDKTTIKDDEKGTSDDGTPRK